MSVQFSFRLHKYCQHTRKLWDESCTFFCARIRAYFYIISRQCESIQVLWICRLSLSLCQSIFSSHVRFIQSSLHISLSVSSRGGPRNLVQSHVEQNLVLDQFCEPTPAHKGDNFMESHEKRRNYVEILYNTSVFRLCPGRQFISWTVFRETCMKLNFASPRRLSVCDKVSVAVKSHVILLYA